MTLRLNGVTSSVLKSPLLLPLLLLLTVSSSSAFFTDGTRGSYVQYPRWQACLNTSISFEFKSLGYPHGVLFYTDDGLFELRLVQRKLMLRIKPPNLHIRDTSRYIFANNYKDLDKDQWHKVKIQLNTKETILTVDDFKIRKKVPENDVLFGSLERNNFVILGGMPARRLKKYTARWHGQIRNLQYSNCSCPLRSAKIMKLSRARRDNLCETNNPCDKNNPNCDCLIDSSGNPKCDCTDKSCDENACKSTSLVKVGSSDQLGCYKGENQSQCWRTNSYDYSKRCNISNEMCTMSLHKQARCTCVNNWTVHYCDFRTGKRYGCHKGHSTCWRTCDKETDEKCSSEGWCFANTNGIWGYCRKDASCLEATTMPCTDWASG